MSAGLAIMALVTVAGVAVATWRVHRKLPKNERRGIRAITVGQESFDLVACVAFLASVVASLARPELREVALELAMPIIGSTMLRLFVSSAEHAKPTGEPENPTAKPQPEVDLVPVDGAGERRLRILVVDPPDAEPTDVEFIQVVVRDAAGHTWHRNLTGEATLRSMTRWDAPERTLSIPYEFSTRQYQNELGAVAVQVEVCVRDRKHGFLAKHYFDVDAQGNIRRRKLG